MSLFPEAGIFKFSSDYYNRNSMATIIVVTNFSESSRNALDYTCSFLGHAGVRILLLNIYSFPAALTSDAISVAAMSETIAADERLLEGEYEWVKTNYPEVNVERAMVTGNFMEELQDITEDKEVALIVMGAGGNYNDLLSWDTNIIDAFVDLQTPVLVIPLQVKYQPVKRVAFACNYYRKDLQTPVSLIKRLVHFTGANLYVIHVVHPSEVVDEEALKSKQLLQQSLDEIKPVYFEPAFNNIINAIDNFTAAENIDMLIVIPARHGIWHNIFQKQHTKGLVYLNHIPVMSLYREGTFI
jgi:nucleotide-binding universal stress UspA family protein